LMKAKIQVLIFRRNNEALSQQQPLDFRESLPLGARRH